MDLLEAVGGEDPKPINLTFKGIKSMQQDLSNSRILYVDLLKNEGFDLFEKMASMIIAKFLEKGVVTEKELSHTRFDKNRQLWTDKFHATLVHAGK